MPSLSYYLMFSSHLPPLILFFPPHSFTSFDLYILQSLLLPTSLPPPPPFFPSSSPPPFPLLLFLPPPSTRRILRSSPHYPSYLSSECKSLMKRLMEKDANKRLGSSGAHEIKKHAWFKVSGPDVCAQYTRASPTTTFACCSVGLQRWWAVVDD